MLTPCCRCWQISVLYFPFLPFFFLSYSRYPARRRKRMERLSTFYEGKRKIVLVGAFTTAGLTALFFPFWIWLFLYSTSPSSPFVPSLILHGFLVAVAARYIYRYMYIYTAMPVELKREGVLLTNPFSLSLLLANSANISTIFSTMRIDRRFLSSFSFCHI